MLTTLTTIELIQMIANGDLSKVNKWSGLCFECRTNTTDPDYLGILRPLFKTWDKYSGNDLYPIFDPAAGLCAKEQFNTLDLWEGKQLELRIDLCKHLIKELNKFIVTTYDEYDHSTVHEFKTEKSALAYLQGAVVASIYDNTTTPTMYHPDGSGAEMCPKTGEWLC